MTRRNVTYMRVILGTSLAVLGFELLSKAVRADTQPDADGIIVREASDPPRLKLDKCPVSRSNFDSLRIGVPEYAIFDAMPCGKGEVVREHDVGFGRRVVEVRVWKFPREGGGFLIITTTGGDVTSKMWE